MWPGESSSVMTTLDGYQMALKGRAGPALGMAAIASFIAGTFSIIMLSWIAPGTGQLCRLFWAARIFCPDLHGADAGDRSGRRLHGQGTHERCLRFADCLCRVDAISGSPRFVFGSMYLLDGLGFISVAWACLRWPRCWSISKSP